MDAEKKVQLEKRIVVGLMVVFVFFFVRGPLRSLGWFRAGGGLPGAGSAPVRITKPVGAMLADRQAQQEVQVVAAGTPASSVTPLPPPAYTAHAMRDPFAELFPKATSKPGLDTAASLADLAEQPEVKPLTLRVAGVIWGGDKPKAIINGEVYGVHDVVQGAKILEIHQDGVTVEHAGSRVVYSLSSSSSSRGR